MPKAVANRYARALADVVASTANYRQVHRELEDFRAVYRDNADLRAVCETPAVPVGQKAGVLKAIAAGLGCSQVTLNFLLVLLSRYRLPLMEEVVQSFRDITYSRLGVVRVKVSSAAPIKEGERDLLQARFQELTRHDAELEFHVDSGLIGGIVAQIGSIVYDGSIRGQLDRIREQMVGK